MLKRDYLVKQFEEFSRVLAVILGFKRDGSFAEMEEAVRNAAQKYTGLEVAFVEEIDNEQLLDVLIRQRKLTDEQLKMLADLLFEKAEYYLKADHANELSDNCYRKAFHIYNFLKEHATLNFSLDMYYKLEILSQMGL